MDSANLEKCQLIYNIYLGNELLNDTTIEERVFILEFQVAELTDDIITITDDVTNLEEGLTLVESEQIIRDERILGVEIDTSSRYNPKRLNTWKKSSL